VLAAGLTHLIVSLHFAGLLKHKPNQFEPPLTKRTCGLAKQVMFDFLQMAILGPHLNSGGEW
jgi:hypothetical protein